MMLTFRNVETYCRTACFRNLPGLLDTIDEQNIEDDKAKLQGSQRRGMVAGSAHNKLENWKAISRSGAQVGVSMLRGARDSLT